MPATFAITVNENECQGIGYCRRVCPEVFSLDTRRRLAVVKMANLVEGELLGRAHEAENLCPTRAIAIVKAD